MADVDVEFDFENDLNTDVGQPAEAPSSMPASARKNYRQASCKTVLLNYSRNPTVLTKTTLCQPQTVCRHWLRGLCMKGNGCGFLHQFDKRRMPTCRFFAKYNECREPDCPFKHSLEDVKDCNMCVSWNFRLKCPRAEAFCRCHFQVQAWILYPWKTMQISTCFIKSPANANI